VTNLPNRPDKLIGDYPGPSPGGAGCLCLIGLVVIFMAVLLGTGHMSSSGYRYRGLQPLPYTVVIISSLLMGAFGVAVIFASARGFIDAVAQRKLRKAHPSSPWLWRLDWFQGYSLPSIGQRSLIIYVTSTLAWGSVGIFGIWVFWFRDKPVTEGFLTMVIMCIIVPMIALISAFCTVRRIIQIRAFGRPVFQLDTLPFCPGSIGRGHVLIKLCEQERETTVVCHASFICHEPLVGNESEPRQHRHAKKLWNIPCVVEVTMVTNDPSYRRIDVKVTLPENCVLTDYSSTHRINWELTIRGKKIGVDFSETYEIPVFLAS
jgi:hypothetical protein